jgi:phosphoglycerol transferase MdoB-like AlkP superfamily enzyme
MSRTYTMLALFLGVILLATYGIGWWAFALHRTGGELYADVFLSHFYLGLTSAMLLLLVHCLIFTYFLGTGRWVKEVTLGYGMPDEPWHKATRELKRRVFPPALFAMLIGIATAAAGAGAQLQAWPWQVHATLGTLTLLINLWAFRVEFRCLVENARVLAGVLEEVDRVRAREGLASNAEALAQQAARRGPD